MTNEDLNHWLSGDGAEPVLRSYVDAILSHPVDRRIEKACGHMLSGLDPLQRESLEFWYGCPFPEISIARYQLCMPVSSGQIVPRGGPDAIYGWRATDDRFATEVCDLYLFRGTGALLGAAMSCCLNHGLEEYLPRLSGLGAGELDPDLRDCGDFYVASAKTTGVKAGFYFFRFRWLVNYVVPSRIDALSVSDLRLHGYKTMRLK